MLAGKNILVGVCGGIAAYKSAQLVRELKKRNANVRVMMTEAAQRFVTPLTFETLSEHSVALDVFGDNNTSPTAHIDWARWPDIIVLAPATANTIGKIANGIADNFITTTIMATTEKVLFCPAMNVEMYKNVLFQQNVERLRGIGYEFMQPASGDLACGEIGIGRLPESEQIADEIDFILNSGNSLAGKRVLISAGPTREALDPVRYLSNRSSGKMGFALAREAALRGAKVTLVSGPTHLPSPAHVTVHRVESASEMSEIIEGLYSETDIVVMAAAVADYRPAQMQQHKIKKSNKQLTLDLVQTDDILAALGRQKSQQLLVGFALETENELEHATAKLEQKNCDFIVLNNPLTAGAGFNVDTNKITILDRQKNAQQFGLMSKDEAAKKVFDAIERALK